MAGKVKKKKPSKSYQRRASIGVRFYRSLLGVFLVTVFICASGLAYLYFWLTRYEKQSVTGAMRSYMEQVQNRDWDPIYETDATYFTEFNSEEAVTSYLLTLYGNIKASGCTFSLMSIDSNTGYRYYDVYYQQEKVGTLECQKPEGSSVWKVRTIVSGGSYSFDVLDGSTFSINSITITSDYADGESHIPYCFEELDESETGNLPSVTRYTVENLVREPALEIASGDIAVRDYSSSQYYIGTAPTSEQLEEFSAELQDTAIAYSNWITEDGTFYNFAKHLDTSTSFYQDMLAFNNQFFSTHYSNEITDIKVYDVIALGDDAFLGDISFTQTATNENGSRSSNCNYQIYFIRKNGAWKATRIYNISTDSSDGTSDPASSSAAEASASPSAETE